MTTADDQTDVRSVAGGVRDLLRGTGATAESKWVRGLRQGRQGNVLFAAALHGAERSAQGRTLTGLERDLVDTLRAIMSEDEIRAVGAEYRAALNDLGQVPLLPTAVTDRPLDEGFGVEDFKAHLPPMRAENADRDNCALVPLDGVAAGEAIDSAAFQAAVTDVGFGSTVLSGPLPDGSDPTGPTYTARFELESFTCLREVGDGLSGRDEVYWTAAVRSDEHDGTTYQSQEFGAVEKGDTRTFSAGNKVAFDGLAGHYVCLLVQCWEADHSNSDWYDKLHLALEAWLGRPTWHDIVEGIVSGSGGGVVGFILDCLNAVIQFFVSLKESFRNKDDLSCERVIFLDRNALVTLFHQKDATWEFNGDGHHSLRVRYTGEHPTFPAGVLEYLSIRSPSSERWSAPVSLGWLSATAPALCSFDGALHCVYVRPKDRALMWSAQRDGAWTAPTRVGGCTSYFQPSIATSGGKLHVALTTEDGRVGTCRRDGSGWSPLTYVPDAATEQGPSITQAGPYGEYLQLTVQRRTAGIQTYQSLDGGQTWEAILMESPPSTVAGLSTDWMTITHVVAGLDSGGTAYVASRRAIGYDYSRIGEWPGYADAPAISVGSLAMWTALRAPRTGKLLFHLRNNLNGAWSSPAAPPVVGAMAGGTALCHHSVGLAKPLFAMYRRELRAS